MLNMIYALAKNVMTRTDANKIIVYVDLSGTNLSGTNLFGADLFKTNFTDAKITKSTDFTDVINKREAINIVISNPRKTLTNAKKKSNKTKTSKRNIKRSR